MQSHDGTANVGTYFEPVLNHHLHALTLVHELLKVPRSFLKDQYWERFLCPRVDFLADTLEVNYVWVTLKERLT